MRNHGLNNMRYSKTGHSCRRSKVSKSALNRATLFPPNGLSCREELYLNDLMREPCRLPRLKTLQEFDFAQSPVSAVRIADLAAGRYIARAEPVLLIGEAGTGKTHLASGLCVAACEQRRRVRFTTATALVNELVEA